MVFSRTIASAQTQVPRGPAEERWCSQPGVRSSILQLPQASMETILTALKEMGSPGMDTPAFILLIISPTAQKETKTKTNKNKSQRLARPYHLSFGRSLLWFSQTLPRGMASQPPYP